MDGQLGFSICINIQDSLRDPPMVIHVLSSTKFLNKTLFIYPHGSMLKLTANMDFSQSENIMGLKAMLNFQWNTHIGPSNISIKFGYICSHDLREKD